MENPASFRPSAFYFRRALRGAMSKNEAVEIGLHLCCELEMLKQWVRDQGMIPPKWHIMSSEISEKSWGDVVVLPSSDR